MEDVCAYIGVYRGQRSTLDVIPHVLSTDLHTTVHRDPRGSGLAGVAKELQFSEGKSEQGGLPGLFCGCHCPSAPEFVAGSEMHRASKNQGQGQGAGRSCGQPCTPSWLGWLRSSDENFRRKNFPEVLQLNKTGTLRHLW